MKIKFQKISVVAFLICSSCSIPTMRAPDVLKYKIEKEGVAEQKNKTDFSFDNTSSFILTQKYKISLVGNDEKFPHFLIANIKMMVGKKVESDQKMQSISVTDGSAFYDCSNYYTDIKTDQVNGVDEPICEIVPVGYLKLDGGASSIIAK